MFCRSLFVLLYFYFLVIVLSVILWSTDSDYPFGICKPFIENTEVTIKNGQSREIGDIRYTRRRKTNQKHNTICGGRHYTQTNINNVNKTRGRLQTTGGKDEPNISFMRKSLTLWYTTKTILNILCIHDRIIVLKGEISVQSLA